MTKAATSTETTGSRVQGDGNLLVAELASSPASSFVADAKNGGTLCHGVPLLHLTRTLVELLSETYQRFDRNGTGGTLVEE